MCFIYFLVPPITLGSATRFFFFLGHCITEPLIWTRFWLSEQSVLYTPRLFLLRNVIYTHIQTVSFHLPHAAGASQPDMLACVTFPPHLLHHNLTFSVRCRLAFVVAQHQQKQILEGYFFRFTYQRTKDRVVLIAGRLCQMLQQSISSASLPQNVPSPPFREPTWRSAAC